MDLCVFWRTLEVAFPADAFFGYETNKTDVSKPKRSFAALSIVLSERKSAMAVTTTEADPSMEPMFTDGELLGADTNEATQTATNKIETNEWILEKRNK